MYLQQAMVNASVIAAAPALFGHLALGLRTKDTRSVFLLEAKAGIRIAVVKYSDAPPARGKGKVARQPLADSPLCKKVEKAFGKSLKNQEYSLNKVDANHAKKLQKSLRATLESSYFPQHAVLQSTRGQHFLRKEFFVGKPPSFSIGYTSSFCFDVRIVLKGCVCISGIPYDVAPGQTLKMRREALVNASCDQWLEFISKGGWITQVHAGEVMAVPIGFSIAMVYLDYAFGVRLSIKADAADDMRALASSEQLARGFPETKSTQSGCPQFIEFLVGG